MATTEQVEKIREHVQKVVGFDENDTDAYNMRNELADLSRLHELLTPLSTYPIESLPSNTAHSIIFTLESLHSIMDEIHEAYSKRESQYDKRILEGSLVVQLHNQTDTIVSIVAPWIPYLAYKQGLSYDQGDLQQKIQQITDTAATTRADEQEVARILVAMREASAEAGVATFAGNFKNKANDLEKTARRWLRTTAVFVGVTISVAIVFLFLPMGKGSFLTQLLQVGMPKFIILGLLLTATVWCGRMYKATKHQAAVNEFRAIGLKTFRTFVEATDDAATRNAVLLETTRAIFAHAPTGLIDAKAGDSEGSVRIVEMVRDAARKATDDAG